MFYLQQSSVLLTQNFSSIFLVTLINLLLTFVSVFHSRNFVSDPSTLSTHPYAAKFLPLTTKSDTPAGCIQSDCTTFHPGVSKLFIIAFAFALIKPFSLSSVITARFLLNMRYMEVYPNATTLALTTLAITTDWQPQTKPEDFKEHDPSDAAYNKEVFSVETRSMASQNMDEALIRPSRAMLSYEAAKEISGLLEKTFCA